MPKQSVIQQPFTKLSAFDEESISTDLSTFNHLVALRRGIIKHAEHAADLILVQGAIPGTELIQAYSNVIQDLTIQASEGVVNFVNEKIDGSPSKKSC